MTLKLDQLDVQNITVAVDRQRTFHEGEGSASLGYLGEDGRPFGRVTAKFELGYSGISIYELTFAAIDVDGQFLRWLSLPDLKAAILDGVQEALPIKWAGQPYMSHGVAQWRAEWPNGDRLDHLLEMVAYTYNRAADRGMPPTQHVAKVFAVSRATAGRMVAKAREAGNDLRSPAPYPGKRREAVDEQQPESNP